MRRLLMGVQQHLFHPQFIEDGVEEPQYVDCF
jgi:hypothetical protein